MSEETPLEMLEDASESTVETMINVTILVLAAYGGVDLGRRAVKSVKSIRAARKLSKETSENNESTVVVN